jgi:hypothetical protein
LAIFLDASGATAQTDPSACITAHADGQLLRAKNKLIAARERFQTCSAPDCPDIIRQDCLEFGDAVDRSLPILRLRPKFADGRPILGAVVDMDGFRLSDELASHRIAVDPGNHRFRFYAPNLPAVEIDVSAKTGDHERIVVAEFPSEKAPRTPVWPSVTYALVGLGAAGIASFVGFGLAGKSVENELDECKPNCTNHQLTDRMHTRYLIADISLGVGLGALGGAAYLFFTGRSSSLASQRNRAFSVDLRTTSDGATVLTTARF